MTAARLRIIRADAGYAGRMVEWVRLSCGWTLEITRRTSRGIEVLTKRWVIERTFAWLGKFRRLSKDYECLTESSQALLYVAMIQITVSRLNKASHTRSKFAKKRRVGKRMT